MAKSDKAARHASRQAEREAKLANPGTPLETKAAGVAVPAGEVAVEATAPAAAPPKRKKAAGFDTPAGTMVTAKCGAFILKTPKYERGTTEILEEGNTLYFTDGRVMVDDEETLQLVKDAISGELGQAKKEAAAFNQLMVVAKGKLPPPIPAWDSLPDNQVLNVAGASGVLSTQEDVQRALDYETQKPLHEDSTVVGEPCQRPAVVHWLQSMVDRGLDAPLNDPVAPGTEITFAIG